MKRALCLVGKIFQAGALVILPAAIWAGQLGHDEEGAIRIFVASLALFGAGTVLTRSAAG